ncbi:thiamine biosynthesis lipoprotein [Kribbella antiqua]|uniref:FAD:protein FMN transferase n=1 Tax=Kribbella antiqua TaxID=2512217 RepID=A0A4R2IY32_9ACTN|nr:FAD:protein FMN transferase [Kribbella antiqua]TCO50454.1 thiamine biosynthesis lipoprotein [Kribbella antiqua]
MNTARYVEHVMGMPIGLALRGRHTSDAQAHQAWSKALAILRDADRVFSTYRPDSYISRLNRGEIQVADCPPEVAEVLNLGEQARRESGDAFNVRRSGALDPSGVVKGWAVERAAQALAKLAGTDYCLSAGGDMTCHVASPDSPAWRIGIEDPHHLNTVAAVVPIRNGAIATSGLKHRGNHITDARTGMTPTAVASVTVVHSNLTWADIDATAAFAKGSDALTWLASRPGRTGLVVLEDGTRHVYRSNATRLATC